MSETCFFGLHCSNVFTPYLLHKVVIAWTAFVSQRLTLSTLRVWTLSVWWCVWLEVLRAGHDVGTATLGDSASWLSIGRRTDDQCQTLLACSWLVSEGGREYPTQTVELDIMLVESFSKTTNKNNYCIEGVITCTVAQRVRRGRVPAQPWLRSIVTSSPGAYSSTFIFTDTAKLRAWAFTLTWSVVSEVT